MRACLGLQQPAQVGEQMRQHALFLLLGGDLEHLLHHIVSIAVRHHVADLGLQLFDDSIYLLVGGPVEELLDDPAAHVLLGERVENSLQVSDGFQGV